MKITTLLKLIKVYVFSSHLTKTYFPGICRLIGAIFKRTRLKAITMVIPWSNRFYKTFHKLIDLVLVSQLMPIFFLKLVHRYL
jgi:hypothetical protein